MNPKTRAVVLSGGGANGGYEIGVLKALFDGKSPATHNVPLDPDIFTGTSVGSFNASYLVSRTDASTGCAAALKELEKIWLDRVAEHPEGCDNGVFRLRADFLDYLDPRCILKDPLKPLKELAEDTTFFATDSAKRAVNFFTSAGPLAQRGIELFDMGTFFSTAPLHGLIADTVDIARALKSPKILKVIATNWDEGRPAVFRNRAGDDLPGGAYDVYQLNQATGHKAILASTAIPAIFPPVHLTPNGAGKEGARYFVDGGVLMNTPLSPAIKAGAEEIHVVYLEPKLEKLPAGYLPNMLDTLNRFLLVASSAVVNGDISELAAVNRQVATAKRLEPLVQHLRKNKTDRDRLQKIVPDEAIKRTGKFIDGLAHRKEIALHRHFPSKSLGGVLGLLDFRRSRMARLVDMGYDDTVKHDCVKNRCVLPEQYGG